MELKIQRKNNYLILLFFVALMTAFLTSCNKKAIVEDYRSLKHAEWNQDTVLVFDINIPDPKKLYDLSFTVRNEGHYGYSNLWIFVTITPPSGKELTDTVELTLAKPSGEWLGSGLGDLYDRKYPYKKTIFFPEIGKYTISVRQGMRTKTGILTGIHDFGISLDKAL
ncbi:MAG: gliding motility lipoprotein GldH [Bacteroidia bacterium]|nr:gliding motility lipoprotein GldH [Bacteroidia bacterium]